MTATTDPLAIRAALTAPGALFEIHDEPVRGVTMPAFRRRLRSLRAMIEASIRYGDRTYIVDGETRLTFAAHLAAVRSLARVLQDQYRVTRGDRVAIFRKDADALRPNG
jgi:long-chain acyl-CoA synthetase